jgi:hypothetical protein
MWLRLYAGTDGHEHTYRYGRVRRRSYALLSLVAAIAVFGDPRSGHSKVSARHVETGRYATKSNEGGVPSLALGAYGETVYRKASRGVVL